MLHRSLFDTRLLLLLMAIFVTSSACSERPVPDPKAVSKSKASISMGDLAGDIFLRMKSGDVKRGAGLDVLVIAATPQFEGEWSKITETDRQERARLVKEFEEATERANKLAVETVRTEHRLKEAMTYGVAKGRDFDQVRGGYARLADAKKRVVNLDYDIKALDDNCQDIVDSIYCHDIVDPKLSDTV